MAKTYKYFFFFFLFAFFSCQTAQQSAAIQPQLTSYDYYLNALQNLDNNQFKKAEENLLLSIKLSDKKSAFLYEELADCQIALSKFPEAEQNYKKAIALEKTNVQYYENLEHFYFSVNKTEQAGKILHQILTMESNNENALYDMASLSLSTKNYEKAAEYYNKLLALYPDNTEALIHLVRIYAAQKHYTQALHTIQIFSNTAAGNSVLQLEQAFCLKQLGRYQQALLLLKQIPAEKDNPVILQETAEIYYLTDDITNAKQCLNALSDSQQYSFLYSTMNAELTSSNQTNVLQQWNYILSVDPLNLIAYYGSARSYEKLSDHTNAALSYILAGKVAYSVSNLSLAERCFRKAGYYAPYDTSVTLMIAYILEARNKNQEAVQTAQTGLKQNQSSFTLHYYLGSLYDKLNKKKSAFQEYQTAYSDNTNSIETLVKLGYLASELNQNKEALLYFTKAFSKTNDSSLAFVLGLTYLSLEQYDKALIFLNQYKQTADKPDKIYYYLGLCYYQLHQIPSAVSNLNLAVKTDPDDIESCNFLGYLLADNNQELPRAERLIRKALKQNPQNPSYQDSLGWVLFKQKHYKQAIEMLETAKADFEAQQIQEPAVYEHLGDVYYYLENYSKALYYFKKSYQIDKNPAVLKKINNAKNK